MRDLNAAYPYRALALDYILVTVGPRVDDPLDVAPLLFNGHRFAACSWLSRLGIWLVRRHLREVVNLTKFPNPDLGKS